MEYVKMPEVLSPEVIRALEGNFGELRDMLASDNAVAGQSSNSAAPRNVKFILFLNNVVIVNINASVEEEAND